jgi:hypothetical protein
MRWTGCSSQRTSTGGSSARKGWYPWARHPKGAASPRLWRAGARQVRHCGQIANVTGIWKQAPACYRAAMSNLYPQPHAKNLSRHICRSLASGPLLRARDNAGRLTIMLMENS